MTVGQRRRYSASKVIYGVFVLDSSLILKVGRKPKGVDAKDTMDKPKLKPYWNIRVRQTMTVHMPLDAPTQRELEARSWYLFISAATMMIGRQTGTHYLRITRGHSSIQLGSSFQLHGRPYWWAALMAMWFLTTHSWDMFGLFETWQGFTLVS